MEGSSLLRLSRPEQIALVTQLECKLTERQSCWAANLPQFYFKPDYRARCQAISQFGINSGKRLTFRKRIWILGAQGRRRNRRMLTRIY